MCMNEMKHHHLFGFLTKEKAFLSMNWLSDDIFIFRCWNKELHESVWTYWTHKQVRSDSLTSSSSSELWIRRCFPVELNKRQPFFFPSNSLFLVWPQNNQPHTENKDLNPRVFYFPWRWTQRSAVMRAASAALLSVCFCAARRAGPINGSRSRVLVPASATSGLNLGSYASPPPPHHHQPSRETLST